MIYLTGASNGDTMDIAYAANLGLMLNPASRYKPAVHLPNYPIWAADNGCFSQGDRFEIASWLRWLDTLLPWRQKCLFVVAPDRFDPSGMWQGQSIARATLDRSLPTIPAIRERGYKVALVAQNGLEDIDIPWDAFDALFIGGDTSWKLSPMALMIAREAKALGKHVHMGRVNSAKRYRAAAQIGCDSADGTYIKYGPDVNLAKMLKWGTAA
jgi:hypothetical protein